MSDEKTGYCLDSVLNHVLVHQTIAGLEAKNQFEMLNAFQLDLSAYEMFLNGRLCEYEPARINVPTYLR